MRVGRLPPGSPTRLHLDRSDPDLLTLFLTSSDSCFSSRGARQQTVEREE